MPDDRIRAALESRNLADRKDVRFQLLMGIPFSLFGLLVANAICLPLLVFLPVSLGCGVTLLLLNALLVVIIVIDLRRHPQEEWYRPQYTTTSGEKRDAALGSFYLRGDGGLSAGMPLMTNMSDPRNVATRARAIANGFANLILGGPRSIQRALALRRQIASRSSRRTVQAAEQFVAWLASKGVVPEEDVQARLETHPSETAGLQLARELEVVTRRAIQGAFHYHLR
jgi:hypothetical protein